MTTPTPSRSPSRSATPRPTSRSTPAPWPAWPAASWRPRGSAAPSISIALVDDATIHAVNRRHLGHDWPTDVISFRLSEPGRAGAGRRAGRLGRDGRGDGARGGRRPAGRAGPVRGPRLAAPVRLRRPDAEATWPRCGAARPRSWPREGFANTFRRSAAEPRRGTGDDAVVGLNLALDARPGPAGPGPAPGLGHALRGRCGPTRGAGSRRSAPAAAVPSGPTRSPTRTSGPSGSAEALAVLTGLVLAALLGGWPPLGRRVAGPARGRGDGRHRPGASARLGYVAGRGGRPGLRRGGPGRLWPAAGAAPRPDRPADGRRAAWSRRWPTAARPGRPTPRRGRPASRSRSPPTASDPRGPRGRPPRVDPRAARARRRADPPRRLGDHDPALGDLALPARSRPRAAARAFRETGQSRIPLFGENRDDIVGILYAKDLFPAADRRRRPRRRRPPQARPPAYCVPETKNAYRAARRVPVAADADRHRARRVRRRRRAWSRSKTCSRSWSGRSTTSTTSRRPTTRSSPLGGARYEVDAALDLEDLNERLGLHLPTDGDFQTVGGLAFHALGRLPEPGALVPPRRDRVHRRSRSATTRSAASGSTSSRPPPSAAR